MMKMSQWRPCLTRFLNRYIVIEGYGVAEPDEYGIFMAHLPPIAAVKYTKSPPDIATGTGIQDIYILGRYPGEIPYNALPVSTLEGMYCTLAMHLELEYSKLDDPALPGVPLLQTATTQRVDYPLKFEELSYANKDWLAVLHFRWAVSWIAEPETAIDTVLLDGIDLEVYRSTLRDLTDATLDWKVTL